MADVAFLRRHPIVLFVVVTFAWSWAWWIPMAMRGEIVRAGAWPTHFPGLIGPWVGALATTAVVDGVAGLRAFASSLVRWRVDVKWALVAALSPFAMLLVAFVALRVSGAPLPKLASFEKYSGLPRAPIAIVFLAAVVVNGFGEESGWRGFLLPRLCAKRSPLAATLLLAPIWAAGHMPTCLSAAARTQRARLRAGVR